FFFFFQAEDGIRDFHVTGVQTCALPILDAWWPHRPDGRGRPRANTQERSGCPGEALKSTEKKAVSPRRSGRDRPQQTTGDSMTRSEERRVGKEGRCRGWTQQ